LGQAASMGSLLAAAGSAGKRYILPNARHMIHQPLGGASGQATDVEIQARELLRWKEVLINIYVQHTGRDYETLRHDMERDNFMTADQALQYGLVDKIVTQRDL
jgi:ATP-dependent Clp protease protease subunit